MTDRNSLLDRRGKPEEIGLLALKEYNATWLISQLAYDARNVVQLPATKLPDACHLIYRPDRTAGVGPKRFGHL